MRSLLAVLVLILVVHVFSIRASQDCISECKPGQYNSTTAGCQKCRMGMYSNEDTCGKCENCPSGTFSSVDGASSCEPCPAGTMMHKVYSGGKGANYCEKCALGTYSTQQGRTGYGNECDECPSGSFGTLVGATSLESTCLLCPAGTWSTNGATRCTFCPAGTASENDGAKSENDCKKCLPGTYAISTGSAACVPCLDGWFTNQEGSVKCQPCSPGYTSNKNGTACMEIEERRTLSVEDVGAISGTITGVATGTSVSFGIFLFIWAIVLVVLYVRLFILLQSLKSFKHLKTSVTTARSLSTSEIGADHPDIGDTSDVKYAEGTNEDIERSAVDHVPLDGQASGVGDSNDYNTYDSYGYNVS